MLLCTMEVQIYYTQYNMSDIFRCTEGRDKIEAISILLNDFAWTYT